MSSFKKRTTEIPIPGTKTSLQNGQTITSSGNPSLDHIIGGGLPIGSIILVEEDRFVTYSKVLAKYFLAEGVISQQSIFLGSLDDNPQELVRKLPNAVEIEEKDVQRSRPNCLNPDADDMRIAWRYNNLPQVNSEQSSSTIGHNFNLLEQMSEKTLQNADVTLWKGDEQSLRSKIFQCEMYSSILEKIASVAKADKFSTSESKVDKSLLRICLTSFASPLWYDDDFGQDLIKFLTILKSIVRNTQSVCFLTMPLHLISKFDDSLIPRIRNLVEYSIELESFAGSDKETNPAFKEYNGIFHLRKISALNSLAVFIPETTDLAFKLRRKKFVIEKLHLPPELQEPDQSTQDDIVPSLSCGSNTKNLLEF